MSIGNVRQLQLSSMHSITPESRVKSRFPSRDGKNDENQKGRFEITVFFFSFNFLIVAKRGMVIEFHLPHFGACPNIRLGKWMHFDPSTFPLISGSELSPSPAPTDKFVIHSISRRKNERCWIHCSFQTWNDGFLRNISLSNQIRKEGILRRWWTMDYFPWTRKSLHHGTYFIVHPLQIIPSFHVWLDGKIFLRNPSFHVWQVQ